MEDEKIKELEERLKNQRAERNYNFFKPVGQIIEHVDTINFSMDKDGEFHFQNVGQVNAKETHKGNSAKEHRQNCETVGSAEASHGEDKGNEEGLPTAERMVEACERTLVEGLWWSNTPWSVVYRIYCIKGYKGTIADFIDDVQRWPFKKPFAKKCNRYSVEKPLRRAKIMGPIEKWRADGASEREIKLGERLAELLSVEIEEGTA